MDDDDIYIEPLCCVNGSKAWCKKYFLEGQLRSGDTVDSKNRELPPNPYASYFQRNRNVIGLIIPVLLCEVFWWSAAIKLSLWPLFVENWHMSVTMMFGSIIAGMTSEGGASVVFPVMTLAFGIEPSVARDVSLMLQSVGMSSASSTIFMMGIQVEWNSIVWSNLGGAIGLVFGLEVIDPLLTPIQKKMGFVSIWFAFAFALYLLNRYHNRPTFSSIPFVTKWKVLVLMVVGFLGGIITAVTGSGLDICSFSILTLLFRITEKVATPTSIILMAANSIVGFYWRGVIMQAIDPQAWSYFTVCMPFVVAGASFGSFVGSHFHRLVLAGFIYVIDIVSLMACYFLEPLSPALIGTSVGIIAFGLLFFFVLTKLGEKLLDHINGDMEQSEKLLESTNTIEKITSI